jgi:hypothetical protein
MRRQDFTPSPQYPRLGARGKKGGERPTSLRSVQGHQAASQTQRPTRFPFCRTLL